MKTTILALSLLIAGASATAQNKYFEIYTDSAALKNHNDELIADMETMIKKVNPSFSFNGVSTEIPNSFMPGQFRSKTNKIYHLTWAVGGPPMEGFLTALTGSNEDGKKMGGLFFTDFSSLMKWAMPCSTIATMLPKLHRMESMRPTNWQ